MSLSGSNHFLFTWVEHGVKKILIYSSRYQLSKAKSFLSSLGKNTSRNWTVESSFIALAWVGQDRYQTYRRHKAFCGLSPGVEDVPSRGEPTLTKQSPLGPPRCAWCDYKRMGCTLLCAHRRDHSAMSTWLSWRLMLASMAWKLCKWFWGWGIIVV
jgi:hypothetical protein